MVLAQTALPIQAVVVAVVDIPTSTRIMPVVLAAQALWWLATWVHLRALVELRQADQALLRVTRFIASPLTALWLLVV
jgi:hypothetical protein